MKASIIIPIRNQIDCLKVTLKAFEKQNVPLDIFEVIIVDDGSDEPVKKQIDPHDYLINITIITLDKMGRSEARNEGAKKASSKLLIFCDADRFPGKNFINSHIQAHQCYSNSLVIGNIKELYISNIESCVTDILEDPDCMINRAKTPPYPRTVLKLYEKDGTTTSSIPWISTFSGNMSLNKSDFYTAGKFNTEFTEWGFEHFELGYRLFKNKLAFYFQSNAVNYHLAHKRDVDKLPQYIQKSIEIMKTNHQDYETFDNFLAFMFGKNSLQNIEKNKKSNWLNNVPKELYFTIGSLR